MAAAMVARRSRARSRCSGSAAGALAADAGLVRARNLGAHEPAVAPAAGLAPVQAPIDEDAREPDLERPRLAVRSDMGEDLDERVLDDLVGVGRIPEILVGDARRATLMDLHKRAETLARLIHLAALDQAPDVDCEPRILGQRRDRPPRRGARLDAGVSGVQRVDAGPCARVGVARSSQITIHRVIRCRSGVCLQLTASRSNC